MNRACLIVQRVSFDHITHVTHFIRGALDRHFDSDVDLIICDEIDDAKYDEGTTVFVIGEGFQPHTQRSGCLYVYLNFSIVAVMGNPLQLSKIGWSAIRRKRRMLHEKLANFDVVLDYFPPQTARLKRQLGVPVFGFNVAIDPEAITASTPMHDRPYDVCFVGGMTPRRQKVLAELADEGLKLSPHKGVIYEEMAAQSRCCINIHAYRSNHLETPRVIGAIATQTPIITEPSYGLHTLLPEDLVMVAKLRNIAKAAQGVCASIDVQKDRQMQSQDWYRHVYLPQCHASWAEICNRVKNMRKSEEIPNDAVIAIS